MNIKWGTGAIIAAALLAGCQAPTSGVVSKRQHDGLAYKLQIDQDDSPNPLWQVVSHATYKKCIIGSRYPNCSVS